MPISEFEPERNDKPCENQSDQTIDVDAAEQQRLLEEYIKQQRRLACPACGEEPFLG